MQRFHLHEICTGCRRWTQFCVCDRANTEFQIAAKRNKYSATLKTRSEGSRIKPVFSSASSLICSAALTAEQDYVQLGECRSYNYYISANMVVGSYSLGFVMAVTQLSTLFFDPAYDPSYTTSEETLTILWFMHAIALEREI